MTTTKGILCTAIAASALVGVQTVSATEVQVTVTHQGPLGGVFLTPVWVGFHNGSFDSYDGNTQASSELKSLAELGDASGISTNFLNNGTLAPNPPVPTQTGNRIDGSVGGGPIGPNTAASTTFNIDAGGDHRYFSYAAMVLPSSDYFVANGGAQAHDLSSLANATPGTKVSFNIGHFSQSPVNDAGTELNDFATSPGNGLVGITTVGTPPVNAPDNNNLIRNVSDPYGDFLNASPANFDFTNVNFHDPVLYANGIATISLTVVPEPATALVMGVGVFGLATRRSQRKVLATLAH